MEFDKIARITVAGFDSSAPAQSGAGMSDIAGYERRIMAAMDRIGRGLEALRAAEPAPAPAEPVAAQTAAPAGDLALALEEERMANAQLTERLRLLKDRAQTAAAAAEARIAALEAEVARLNVALEDMGAARATQIAEMDAILDELAPLVGEARDA